MWRSGSFQEHSQAGILQTPILFNEDYSQDCNLYHLGGFFPALCTTVANFPSLFVQLTSQPFQSTASRWLSEGAKARRRKPNIFRIIIIIAQILLILQLPFLHYERGPPVNWLHSPGIFFPLYKPATSTFPPQRILNPAVSRNLHTKRTGSSVGAC